MTQNVGVSDPMMPCDQHPCSRSKPKHRFICIVLILPDTYYWNIIIISCIVIAVLH